MSDDTTIPGRERSHSELIEERLARIERKLRLNQEEAPSSDEPAADTAGDEKGEDN